MIWQVFIRLGKRSHQTTLSSSDHGSSVGEGLRSALELCISAFDDEMYSRIARYSNHRRGFVQNLTIAIG